LGLFQREVAERFSVNIWTYLLWEQDRTTPTIRYYPLIFLFLGYDPYPTPSTLAEKIAAKRRELGLPVKQAAKLVGVDEGTFSRWESGEGSPRLLRHKADRFLGITSIKTAPK
jgi:transcriptional regulator with XRE-family HTH domain